MPDHRKLGRELGLFDTDPLIGAGLPYWLPAGAAVRHALEEYVRGVERRSGYQHVYSPVLAKRELYELSGHWSHYLENLYPPMDLGDEQLVLRPVMCPHHALIYRSRPHSYRDLPLRMAELGGMYRSELSGVLGGLTRVRAIQLNDAHIFARPDQVADEVRAALELIRQAYQALGISPSRYRLSLPGTGGKYIANPDMWRQAEAVLRDVLDESGLAYDAVDGEAAFYGPKIDVQVTDSAGREATLSTVQVDFHHPAQFDLRYIGPDGGKHPPVKVHLSIIGSMERAVAQLIEVHGGAFPAWLAPWSARRAPPTARSGTCRPVRRSAAAVPGSCAGGNGRSARDVGTARAAARAVRRRDPWAGTCSRRSWRSARRIRTVPVWPARGSTHAGSRRGVPRP